MVAHQSCSKISLLQCSYSNKRLNTKPMLVSLILHHYKWEAQPKHRGCWLPARFQNGLCLNIWNKYNRLTMKQTQSKSFKQFK